MPRRIPRRTREIELWDAVPIGNRAAWMREISQFWALMLTRGRRVRTPAYLMVDTSDTDPAVVAGHGGRLPPKRPLVVDELADRLSKRLASRPDTTLDRDQQAEVARWFAGAVVFPGERIRWLRMPPAGGLAVPHYLPLAVFNRGTTRERYWAAFFFSALKSDLDYWAAHPGEPDLAGHLLDEFLSAGLTFTAYPTASSTSISWAIDREALSQKDPEVRLTAEALAASGPDQLPSAEQGLPDGWFAGVLRGESYDEFLCPGMIVLLRRALRLVLGQADTTSHSALAEMVETLLVNHAALYFVRGMRVINELSARRELPTDCTACWDRFQGDVRPGAVEQESERWASGEYRGQATRDDARWVEDTCRNPIELFVNAGRKEQQDAKDLARLTLENLRQQLAEYTVNRITLRVAWDVAKEAAGPGRPPPSSLRDVFRELDALYADPSTRLMLASLWRAKIRYLLEDTDVPGSVRESAEAWPDLDDPVQLESRARYVVGETILSSRTFTRYVEVLHSLLGGGSLPTNQDPKGMLARGGKASTGLHMSLNDRALETMVAIASLEAAEDEAPLSFQGFVEFLGRRYDILVDRAPAQISVAPGLVADAAAQSRDQLRSRLASMGFLTEFSDSSGWNRVRWGRAQ